MGVGAPQATAKASKSIAMTPRFSHQSLARTFTISSWSRFKSILLTLTKSIRNCDRSILLEAHAQSLRAPRLRT